VQVRPGWGRGVQLVEAPGGVGLRQVDRFSPGFRGAQALPVPGHGHRQAAEDDALVLVGFKLGLGRARPASAEQAGDVLLRIGPPSCLGA